MELAGGGEMYDRVVGKGRYTEIEARTAVCLYSILPTKPARIFLADEDVAVRVELPTFA